MSALPPGSTIGILGGGQLGRMLAIAAAQLGYRCHIYAPEPSGPARDVCARWTMGNYADVAALAAFAGEVDVVTYEFENIPTDALGAIRPVRPPVRALAIAQDRVTEKRFAEDHEVRCAPWRAVDDRRALDAALREFGAPAILKTRRLGYDGKGQARIAESTDAGHAWEAIGARAAVVEALVRFDSEFSILLCRGEDGAVTSWPPVANEHRDGVLARSTVPASGLAAEQAPEALAAARTLAEALGYVGLLALEFFATTDGPVFNEMAPRVHNSGHWTIEGSVTSQFENHIRAICGLPLGATALTGASVTMENLIGGAADLWPTLFAEPGAHVHLYGKHVRPGRKMGHVTRVER